MIFYLCVCVFCGRELAYALFMWTDPVKTEAKILGHLARQERTLDNWGGPGERGQSGQGDRKKSDGDGTLDKGSHDVARSSIEMLTVPAGQSMTASSSSLPTTTTATSTVPIPPTPSDPQKGPGDRIADVLLHSFQTSSENSRDSFQNDFEFGDCLLQVCYGPKCSPEYQLLWEEILPSNPT